MDLHTLFCCNFTFLFWPPAQELLHWNSNCQAYTWTGAGTHWLCGQGSSQNNDCGKWLFTIWWKVALLTVCTTRSLSSEVQAIITRSFLKDPFSESHSHGCWVQKMPLGQFLTFEKLTKVLSRCNFLLVSFCSTDTQSPSIPSPVQFRPLGLLPP